MSEPRQNRAKTEEPLPASGPWLEFFRQVRLLAARLDALERNGLEAENTQKEQMPGG